MQSKWMYSLRSWLKIFIGSDFCEACGSFRRTLESGKALSLRMPLAGLDTDCDPFAQKGRLTVGLAGVSLG